MSDKQVGTLAQALEQNVDSWVNHEFNAVVSGVSQKATKNQTTMWLCTISDPDNPGIKCEFTLFGWKTFPFEGALCSFGGQGMKVTDYKGTKKIQGSNKTQINKLGNAPASSIPPKDEKQTGASSGGGGASNRGQRIGMALNNAFHVAITLRPADPTAARAWVESPDFSRLVYNVSSDALRVSDMLEAGRLAPSARDRADPEGAKKRAAEEQAKREAEEKAKREAEEKAKRDAEEKAKAAAGGSGQPQQQSFGGGAAIDEDVPFAPYPSFQ